MGSCAGDEGVVRRGGGGRRCVRPARAYLVLEPELHAKPDRPGLLKEVVHAIRRVLTLGSSRAVDETVPIRHDAIRKDVVERRWFSCHREIQRPDARVHSCWERIAPKDVRFVEQVEDIELECQGPATHSHAMRHEEISIREDGRASKVAALKENGLGIQGIKTREGCA